MTVPGSFQPAFLSLIMGLVLQEEISLSWLNASMMVRATPSVSAFSLTSPIGPDLWRKSLVFVLAIAGAASNARVQKVLTLLGIGGAYIVLLANLGARSWYFLKWRPQRYDGPFANFFAYLAAMLTGMILPYMGHRNIEVGGKAAMEYVIVTAFVVAVCFVISDINKVQNFLVLGSDVSKRLMQITCFKGKCSTLFFLLRCGSSVIAIFSQTCPQDVVNLVVAIWWLITLICSLFLVKQIPSSEPSRPHDGERLLIEDHASPAGYRVPSLPDFEVDPTLAKEGLPFASVGVEFFFGLIMAVAIGTGMIYLSVSQWDNQAASHYGFSYFTSN